MSQAPQPDRAAVLRRPPVRQSTVVRSDIRHTFDTFVSTIGAWWPVQPSRLAIWTGFRAVTVEQRQGGRVYETWDDGTEGGLGHAARLAPARTVHHDLDRHARHHRGGAATFTALGPALTRVTVEHRGWEALTDEQLARDCALPGGYASGGYVGRLDRHPGPFRGRHRRRRPGPGPRVKGHPMAGPELVSYQVVLLRHTAAGRDFDEETTERIFREHLAYTLSLVAGGDQLAAGPVGDSPAEDEDICGLGVYQKDSLDEVRRLIEQDPGVRQGLYRFDVMTWRTAPGTVTPPAAAWARG